MSLLLLIALVTALLPAVSLGEDPLYGYVTIKSDLKNRVANFRQAPNTDDDVNYPIARLPEFWVVELLEKQTVTRNGVAWYHIRANINLDGGPVQKEDGYVMASFLTVMTAAEQAAWLAHPTDTFQPAQPTAGPTATPVPAGAAVGFVRTIVGDVNLRQTPGGKVINDDAKIPLGNVMAYYAFVANEGGYAWVQVQYDGKTGYVRSDCFAYCDAYGNLISNTTPTPAPGTVNPGLDPGAVYGQVTANDVLLRKDAGVSTDYWDRLPSGWKMQVLDSVMNNGVLWYRVQGGTPQNPSRSYIGYIHSSYFTLLSNVPTAVPGSSAESNYALITLDGINLRSTPGGATVVALRANTVVNILVRPAGSSASDWYYIEYYGQRGYIPATALRVLLNAELSNYTLPVGSVTPPPPTAAPAVSGSGYVILTKDLVNVRKTPGGTTLTPTEESRLRINTVLAYTQGPVTFKMNGQDFEWVLVSHDGLTGYVRSDCYVYCSANGTPILNPATSVPTASPGNSGAIASQGYLKLIHGDVNLRVSPWGESLGKLNSGTILPYYSIRPYNNGNELWFEVYSTQFGAFGYVLGTMIQVCDAKGNAISGGNATTPSPINQVIGYVATTASSVWLRAEPKANAATVDQVKNKGTVLALIGVPQSYGTSYLWYPVRTDKATLGYLRGDFAYQLTNAQIEEYNRTGKITLPTAAPATAVPGASEYVVITADKVWVRSTASKQSGTLGQVSSGTILRFYQRTTVGSGTNAVTWYQVSYNGQLGWVHGGFARVMSNSEVTPAPTTAPAVPTLPPSSFQYSDLALTTAGAVNIRATASMTAKSLGRVPKSGAELTYLGQAAAPTADNPYTWYYVRYKDISGWMRGDYVRVLTMAEKAQYLATGSVDGEGARTAIYRTLSKGSTGEDVKALQQQLARLGFLDAKEVTGTYLTSTENAVIAYQKYAKLTVDGIAGSKTQHSLFGTVEGSEGSSVSVTLYPVEKIDWYKGGIQEIWKVGTVAVITDVYTGISFKAQRLYGDAHADCEPLTTADTAAYCRIYKVSEPQEISDREQELHSYRRRPLWVTIGGRTFCASMYGIPHNFEGDKIPDNGYNGQFCVHFVNSHIHRTDAVDVDSSANDYFSHQSAIQYAYTHSISGTK